MLRRFTDVLHAVQHPFRTPDREPDGWMQRKSAEIISTQDQQEKENARMVGSRKQADSGNKDMKPIKDKHDSRENTERHSESTVCAVGACISAQATREGEGLSQN